MTVQEQQDAVVLDVVSSSSSSGGGGSSLKMCSSFGEEQQQKKKKNASSSMDYPQLQALRHHSIDVIESSSIKTAAAAAAQFEHPHEIECRICQEDDERSNMEIPCACCGSLKYAHRKCVQRWCNEKGDTICEICQQPFKSGYTTVARPSLQQQQQQHQASDLGEWDFRDPRLIAFAERHFLQQEYDDYTSANASGASCCRLAALILMALLLLRHTLALGSTAASDEDASTFFMLFVLRAAGFLLPCYIMARAMNMIQRRRQRQEWRASMLEASAAHRISFLNLNRV